MRDSFTAKFRLKVVKSTSAVLHTNLISEVYTSNELSCNGLVQQLYTINTKTMTNTIKTMALTAVTTLVVLAIAMLSMPAFSNAADYAYVDAQGEVKSVTATDWMTAIATALNIHIHSGVYLLKSAADFDHLQEAND